ncbi:MAG TPA: ribonuclease Y, partial [bacterium]
SIETATGVDIIVDDTPEAVIISSFDPQRREIARLALEKLISDGRIHPGRIEEVVEKTSKEVEKTIKEAGERAVFDLGLHGIHPEIIRLLGRLRYRSSYSQNVYAHSMEVAFICGIMASELGLNIKQAKRAALLHDIGKSVDHEIEGTHASIGGELAKKYGESQRIVEAIAEHHNDSPSNILAVLIQASDTLSAARPGVRKEIWETYVKRLNDMERIAKAIPGIDKCYAIQAGRELRVIVMPDKIKDDGIGLVSREIAKKIEAEVAYPGQIKVTVIRELRSVEYAK